MTDLFKCDMHGLYEGVGKCPCCLATQPRQEETLTSMRLAARQNMMNEAAWKALALTEASGPLTEAELAEVDKARETWTQTEVAAMTYVNVPMAQAVAQMPVVSLIYDNKPQPLNLYVAKLEAENASLLALLSAAQDALAYARMRLEGIVPVAAPVEPRPSVTPLERATGVGVPQPCRATLAALAQKVVR